MTQHQQIILAQARIQVAFERLRSAEMNLTENLLRDALHSAYYAVYTSIRVLLNLEYRNKENIMEI